MKAEKKYSIFFKELYNNIEQKIKLLSPENKFVFFGGNMPNKTYNGIEKFIRLLDWNKSRYSYINMQSSNFDIEIAGVHISEDNEIYFLQKNIYSDDLDYYFQALQHCNIEDLVFASDILDFECQFDELYNLVINNRSCSYYFNNIESIEKIELDFEGHLRFEKNDKYLDWQEIYKLDLSEIKNSILKLIEARERLYAKKNN